MKNSGLILSEDLFFRENYDFGTKNEKLETDSKKKSFFVIFIVNTMIWEEN